MKVYNMAVLLSFIDQENSPNYFFFWGHQLKKNGMISKSCLSQWYSASFTADGNTYSTAEHYMMAQKSKLFKDQVTFEKILKAPFPKEVKQLGREVKNFDQSVWEKYRFDIAVKGNYAKFSQNAALKKFLLKTGDAVLVEASPVDSIWGIGMAEDNPDASDPEKWKGLNLLGFALMEIRRKLNDEKS